MEEQNSAPQPGQEQDAHCPGCGTEFTIVIYPKRFSKVQQRGSSRRVEMTPARRGSYPGMVQRRSGAMRRVPVARDMKPWQVAVFSGIYRGLEQIGRASERIFSPHKRK